MDRKRHFGIIFGWSRVLQELELPVSNTVIKFQILSEGVLPLHVKTKIRNVWNMDFCVNRNDAKTYYWGLLISFL